MCVCVCLCVFVCVCVCVCERGRGMPSRSLVSVRTFLFKIESYIINVYPPARTLECRDVSYGVFV